MTNSNPPKSPDQVDALAEFIEWAFHAPTYTKGEYKAKLSALLVDARIAELEWAGDHWLDTKTYLKRIKELEKQREAQT